LLFVVFASKKEGEEKRRVREKKIKKREKRRRAGLRRGVGGLGVRG